MLFLAFLSVKLPACLASFFPSFLPPVTAPGLLLGTWGYKLGKGYGGVALLAKKIASLEACGGRKVVLSRTHEGSVCWCPEREGDKEE